jgi:hypothetical protein
MDTKKLRKLNEEARRQAEIERIDAAERERLALEQNADEIIEQLPAIVTKAAASGCNQYRVLQLRDTEMKSRPREAFGIFGRRHYSPNCLPNYARRIYDYCKAEGLNPRLEDDTIHPPAFEFYLNISW